MDYRKNTKHVTNYNKNRLQEYVDNGYEPNFGSTGAKIVHHDGVQKDLRFVKNIVLSVGDIVERHLQDGDIVLFNRQPSLHKMSMMGHKIKIVPFKTFRMNVCATTPYNADYDGDEMNIHVPQSEITKSEIKELMMVSKCIVSPQSNKPVIGIIQDTLLGSHKITNKDTFVTEEDFFNLHLLYTQKTNKQVPLPDPAILKPKRMYTGKQVFSLLFPTDFNFKKKGNVYAPSQSYDYFDGFVIIRNGTHVCGNLCKKSLGSSEGSIIHLLWLEYGPRTANTFISHVQYIINYWLNRSGFSVGAMDIYLKTSVQKKVFQTIENAKSKVEQIIKVCSTNDNIEIETFENKINQTLNNAMSEAGVQVREHLSNKNNINSTVTGGSKGSMFNIAQIMGCVGQQNVAGKRLNFGYVDRVLPHFEKKDIGPEARGFVENSYKNGLKPHEFFYHAMGGREGIIDTAVKTSETGYIQRRLVKAMEDISIQNDKTVRNSIGDIIQFCYGKDGFDATYLLSETIEHIDPQSEQFRNTFLNVQEAADVSEIMNSIKSDTRIYSPLLLSRLCDEMKHLRTQNTHPEITPEKAYEKICSLCKKWSIYNVKNKITDELNENALCYIIYSVKVRLNTRFIKDNIASYAQLDTLLQLVDRRFQKAIVQTGEMIGTIAAQSLGEPVTQLTLNTFHAAGISAKNVTLGVPRFKELINVAKNLKSPTMRIVLKEGHTPEEIDTIAGGLEFFMLSDIISSSHIFDVDISTYAYFEFPCSNYTMYTYGIRFNVNKSKLKDKKITLSEVCINIMKKYDSLLCIENEDISFDVLVFHDDELSWDSIKMLHSSLGSQEIGGYKEITKVYIEDNILDTEGTCLQEMLGLPFVDSNNTLSNDILEVKEVLGIEAARELLLQEIKKVLEFDGTYINNRHFEVLIDTMTYKGGIMAITRHGINRSDNGVLMKCSFEETVDVLTDAATFAEKDMLKGVTENITIGKLANVGTGTFDLHYNQLFEPEKFDKIIESYDPYTIDSDEEYTFSYYDQSDEEYVDSYF